MKSVWLFEIELIISNLRKELINLIIDKFMMITMLCVPYHEMKVYLRTDHR